MSKKIVILSAFASPYRSGAEACAEEVSALLKDQFDITIITARMSRHLRQHGHLENGVKVRRIGIGRPIDKWLFPFLAPFAAKILYPDIIHAVLESYAGLALVFCQMIVPKARRILTCQSTNTSVLVDIMHRHADEVTAISSVLVERAKRFGKDAVLIPNGIHINELTKVLKLHPKVSGRILFVGRLEPMKGVDTLLTAFSNLAAGSSKLHLRIVGSGSQRHALEKLAVKLGIIKDITFVGRVDPLHVAIEYAQAQIFCGLSRSEALGNVFLEAQAAGCAVVATNVGGIPDIVEHEKTGLLIPVDNVDAAVSAIKKLLDDAALRERLAEEGKKHVSEYDWSRIAHQYAKIYES
jgi:glycosyltransferase involved in cell wall biosynthesis